MVAPRNKKKLEEELYSWEIKKSKQDVVLFMNGFSKWSWFIMGFDSLVCPSFTSVFYSAVSVESSRQLL